ADQRAAMGVERGVGQLAVLAHALEPRVRQLDVKHPRAALGDLAALDLARRMEHQRERLERRAALTLLFPVTAADEVPEVRTLVDVARHALRRAVVRLRQDEPAD